MNHKYEYIQINKLSILHDNHKIFFCKTDYLFSEFENIKQKNNDTILISGNSDYPITDEIINLAPKNIKKWYAQNALSNNAILEPLPIGLENRFFASREGHGIGYPSRMETKENILQNINTNKTSNKFIYANFNINTNINHRNKIKEICLATPFITWREPDLSLKDFYEEILDHKMVLCPAGNGIDTHRLWETLYSNRIPITFKIGNYKIYELYKELPIIILNNISELNNFDLIMSHYYKIINQSFDYRILNIDYWFLKIQSYAQLIR